MKKGSDKLQSLRSKILYILYWWIGHVEFLVEFDFEKEDRDFWLISIFKHCSKISKIFQFVNAFFADLQMEKLVNSNFQDFIG